MKLSLKEQVIGSWSLVSFERQSQDGQIAHPLSEKAMGMILYTADGYMSVQIMDPGRHETIDHAGQAIHYRDLGYLAYTGRYHIDEANEIMTHEPSVSLYPEWVSTQIIRAMKLDGDLLRLGSNGPVGPEQLMFTLLWKRIK